MVLRMPVAAKVVVQSCLHNPQGTCLACKTTLKTVASRSSRSGTRHTSVNLFDDLVHIPCAGIIVVCLKTLATARWESQDLGDFRRQKHTTKRKAAEQIFDDTTAAAK